MLMTFFVLKMEKNNNSIGKEEILDMVEKSRILFQKF